MIAINNIKDTGFMTYNGLYIVESRDNYIKIGVDITDKSLNPYRVVHGGLIYTLADSAMGIVLAAAGKNGVTLNCNIEYLSPGTGKKLFADTEIIKIGKTIAVVKSNVINEENKLIAIATGTYFIKNKE